MREYLYRVFDFIANSNGICIFFLYLMTLSVLCTTVQVSCQYSTTNPRCFLRYIPELLPHSMVNSFRFDCVRDARGTYGKRTGIKM